MTDPRDADGWVVYFEDGPLPGPVVARYPGDHQQMVAALAAFAAIRYGVGSGGEILPGGPFPRRYAYQVVAIDRNECAVRVKLE